MKFIVVILLTLMTGCSMFHGKQNIEVDYPADINQMCIDASNHAQALLAKHGYATTRRWSIKVRTYPGTNKVRGMWAWYDTTTHQNIGGYHSSGIIVVGCSPVNGGEVNFNVLVHEFVHYWMESNGIPGSLGHRVHRQLGLI